ncbi:PTS system, glucitol, sorbitol-specific IIA component [Enterococcus mundtii 3F]|uniref:PTS glucitol/sorbitol transporter subunit IIA n=1 Tax=Enterococcus mundtii TaxID=53346 RepID=UPI00230450BC|nr:PTS glucitol/sorbitol transporter subunit IIA [Enterococcus mundtii]MDA9461442.1 PTS system, glucitol, sorbitol-specific IIA component [Enterococcus mundtii 3F]
MHKTKITEIGHIVEDFAEEFLLVLFGPEAPPELRDICVIHENVSKPENVLRKNGTLTIGQNKYRILEVGSEANANYESLGHISIYFRETENNEILPGAILVEPKVFPTLGLGDEITIE